jgi:hypothetical protein
MDVVVWLRSLGLGKYEAAVNADLIFPKSAEVKFPSLAGMVINRWRDRRLHFLAADHAGAGSAV